MNAPSVMELKTYKTLTEEEMCVIKNRGKPTPKLHLVQLEKGYSSKAGYTRRFDERLYSKKIWLCGCPRRNALFCFVCLLIGGNDSWTQEGVRDLRHIADRIRKHETSLKHKNNFVTFQLLGKRDTAVSLSGAYADYIRDHNNKVLKNRQMVSKVIDILKLCGHCNLPLGGDYGGINSAGKGVFQELVDYTNKIDTTLATQLHDASFLNGTSKTIGNELLDCMFEVCHETILKEIGKSSYVAIMFHDATNILRHAGRVLVFRYELDGKVYERFWGFANLDSQDAEGLSKCILEQLEPLLSGDQQGFEHKLIAQTYDGPAVMRENLHDATAKIKEVYKNAHYINCYSHHLYKLVEQAASCIESARIFFANLSGISTFFSNSPDRQTAFFEVCNKQIPKPSQIRWNFGSGAVLTVFENKELILECFENIQHGIPKQYNLETVSLASGFTKWFYDDTFQFWLSFFGKLMPCVHILFNRLQKINMDALKIQEEVDNFENAINELRNNLACAAEIKHESEPLHQTAKRPRLLTQESLNWSAREICDIIVAQIQDRFAFKSYTSGAKLFLPKNYTQYKNKLPIEDIKNFCEAFPMVVIDDLKVELKVFYSRSEICNTAIAGCLKLLNIIYSLGLDTTSFKEITKVLKILITLPMATSEKERCFSTMKSIKTYLSNTPEEDKLSARVMLIEKDLVENISDFNDQVIEKFAKNNKNRMELNFKQN